MAPERSNSNTPIGNNNNNNNNFNRNNSISQQGQQQQQQQEPASSISGTNLFPKIPNILPHERVFPIQIGSELFKLSGASISSDAPSYFSQYFLCQIEKAKENGTDPYTSMRTLYIDRDPLTFRDISLHLQGYHVSPRDGTHFVRLFADAQFYSVPRLISQLYEESIFMSIGHREFQIPRDLFSDPGNTPNFFSLGFAIFFSNPDEIFPGLNRQGLIRPPSILPPSVPGRSADTFAELLHLLRGYPVHIRDDEHRASLLRDCRYFNFKGLEQRLVPHNISFNQTRHRDEIVLRLEDILKSGISILPDPLPIAGQPGVDPMAGWVNYARPFVDDKPAELVLEIGGENIRLHFNVASPSNNHNNNNNHNNSPPSASSSHSPPSSSDPNNNNSQPHPTRVEFFRDARTRITKLFEVISTKLALPPTTQPLGLLMAQGKSASSQPATPGNTPLSEDDWVKCVLQPETSIMLDGKPYTGHIHLVGTTNTLTAGQTTAQPPPPPVPPPPVPVPPQTAVPSPFYHSATNPNTSNPMMTDPSPHYPHHHQSLPDTQFTGGTGPNPSPSPNDAFSSLSLNNPRKRRRMTETGASIIGLGAIPGSGQQQYWIIKTGQWRLRIQSAKHPGPGRSNVECVLHAVKLDAMSGELARNENRGFLKG